MDGITPFVNAQPPFETQLSRTERRLCGMAAERKRAASRFQAGVFKAVRTYSRTKQLFSLTLISIYVLLSTGLAE